ncbi:MAG: response regulator [Nitrospirota bacterium]
MKKILLVDNTNVVLEMEKNLLDRDIFKVFTALTGEEAIRIHRREKMDVIVMDLNMPNTPGDEVCRLIRKSSGINGVSIMLATLSEDEAEIERCVNAGADAHIKKPLDRHELAESLAKILGIPTRQAIRILVKVKLSGRFGNEFFIANTVDVSVSGLLFESDRELAIGDTIEISFFLAGMSGFSRVIAKSEVMRIAPGDSEKNKRYGTRFTEFKEGGVDIIRDFIAKKTGKSN